MNVLGQVGSLISQGVYSVATPFHPFGGAVDVIVVEQEDGTYRSTPWYVRFGKFQGVLKGAEKIVGISVNGIEAGFHMLLDNSGEAYFVREVVCSEDDTGSNNQNGNSVSGSDQIFDEDVDNERQLYEFDDEQSYHYDSLDRVEDLVESQRSDAEMVLVSVDGYVLTAPISSAEDSIDDVQLSTPQFHLGPGEDAEVAIGQLQDSAAFVYSPNACENAIECDDRAQELREIENKGGQGNKGVSVDIQSSSDDINTSMSRREIFKSCLELSELTSDIEEEDLQGRVSSVVGVEVTTVIRGSKESLLSSLAVVVETEAENCTFENGAIVPIPSSDFQCDDGSGSHKIEVSKKVVCMSSDIVSAHSLNNDTERKDEQVGVAPDSRGIESSTGRLANEEECSTPKKSESQMRVLSRGIDSEAGFEISLCGDLLHAGMGESSAREAFEAHSISEQEFQVSRASIVKNEKLIVRYKDRYLRWDKAAPIVLGMAAFGLDFSVEPDDAISVEQVETCRATKDDTPELSSTPSGRRWRLWPIPFRRVKTLQRNNSNSSGEEVFVDTVSSLHSPRTESISTHNDDDGSPHKQFRRTNTPTMEEIASLNLKDGQNMITFSFSTRVLGKQQVDAHVYLWKWNARIVISDVDGTITRSDVLGQFMPLVGKDWSQSGVARLFSAIKENGYQLLFLSARAIVQAYLTRSFLLNLKQDGNALPKGPIVISPDGLFPSLYREVIRRAPHEFKIACLEDIRQLFPSDCNPFYAGFGNRDTDELTYRKMGIPKGKIFIINPKGEVAINNRIDVKSYTSLHTLVNDMFPPTSLAEQEDFNSWNYWKLPLLNID